MTDVFAAIWKGFPFQLDFACAADAIVDGGVIWLDLRSSADREVVVLSHVEMTRLSPTLFSLELTEAQTELLPEGIAIGDLILRAAGVDTPLGLRLAIPVILSLSGPAA